MICEISKYEWILVLFLELYIICNFLSKKKNTKNRYKIIEYTPF